MTPLDHRSSTLTRSGWGEERDADMLKPSAREPEARGWDANESPDRLRRGETRRPSDRALSEHGPPGAKRGRNWPQNRAEGGLTSSDHITFLRIVNCALRRPATGPTSLGSSRRHLGRSTERWPARPHRTRAGRADPRLGRAESSQRAVPATQHATPGGRGARGAVESARRGVRMRLAASSSRQPRRRLVASSAAHLHRCRQQLPCLDGDQVIE
jgi:hypothetical protein